MIASFVFIFFYNKIHDNNKQALNIAKLAFLALFVTSRALNKLKINYKIRLVSPITIQYIQIDD